VFLILFLMFGKFVHNESNIQQYLAHNFLKTAK